MKEAVEAPHMANPLELLQAIFDAIKELQELDPQSAGAIRARIGSKAIGDVSHEDLLQIRALIRDHQAHRPIEVEATSYAERDYGLFLDAIPQGRKLFDDIESLALSGSFSQLVDRAERVFIDRLGYTRARLDESTRVSRGEFRRIERIGNFGELDIVCVELSRRTWYAVFYDVIFRFHPYALLLSLEPNAEALRFVYREGPSKLPRYRCLTGRQSDWEPNDNLLVWAWRLHELRPRLGETAQTLQRRVSRALELAPEEVGLNWPSVAIDPSRPISGVSWEEAPRRAFESFVQLRYAPNERRRWGLEAILRDRFPIAVAKDESIHVSCSGYELGEEPPSVEECVDRGQSRERDVTLWLQIQCNKESHHVSLRGTLPEPDARGRFVLDGVPYTFTAQVRDDGRLAALPEELADGEPSERDSDDDGLEIDASAEDSESGIEESESASLEIPEAMDISSADNEPPVRGFRGLSPRAFYEYAVSRKLAGLAYTLWRMVIEPDKPQVGQILRRLLSFARRFDHLPLAASTVFRRFLMAHSTTSLLRAESWRVAAHPPSWICLDRSSVLESGLFFPIASARMHPTGSLAIPVEQDSRIRMSLNRMSAVEINPRGLHAKSLGPTDWWIARDLQPFSRLAIGAIETARLAAASVPFKSRVASALGPSARAWVVRSLRLPRPDMRSIHRRVPAGRGSPTLLVQAGAHVGPGTPWLVLAPESWPAMPEVRNTPEEDLAIAILDKMKENSLAAMLRRDPRLVERIPAGVRGVVQSVVLEPVVDPLGVRRSWMARISVYPTDMNDAAIIGPDGAVYPVAGTRAPEDMPFDASGQPFDVLLETPRVALQPESEVNEGTSGDTMQVTVSADGWRWAYHSISTPTMPDSFLRFRTVDGEGIPAHDCSPSISEHERIRWLILDSAAAQPLIQASSRSGRPCWVANFRRAAEAAGLMLTDDLAPSKSCPSLQPGKIHDPLSTQLHRPLNSPEPGAALVLPIDVIHPWRKDATAAVLGLTSPELDRLIEAHGLALVGAAVRQATVTTPYEAAILRIEREPDRRVRVAVGDGLDRLRTLSPHELGEAFWVRAIRIPSPELLPFGFPSGAGRALRTPLLRRYRAIKLACEMVDKFEGGPATIRRLAEIELQRSVENLFGSRVGNSATGHDLAGWLTRLWPLTRPPSLRTATINLGLTLAIDDTMPAIVHSDSPWVTAPARLVSRQPADASWWREHAARSQLISKRLIWFIGLFACLDLPTPERPLLDVDSPSGPLGEWTAREWLRRLERPDARPAQLLDLLENLAPHQLPTEPTAALAALEPILRNAIPGEDSSALRLRLILARILSGFWLTAVGKTAPAGWRWCGPNETPPSKAKRYVPPFASPAWSRWSCIEAALAAPRIALDLAAGRPLPALLRIIAGFPHQSMLDAPLPILAEERSATVEPVRVDLPAVNDPASQQQPTSLSAVPPSPSDTDIEVAKLPLRLWLHSTQNHSNPTARKL